LLICTLHIDNSLVNISKKYSVPTVGFLTFQIDLYGNFCKSMLILYSSYSTPTVWLMIIHISVLIVDETPYSTVCFLDLLAIHFCEHTEKLQYTNSTIPKRSGCSGFDFHDFRFRLFENRLLGFGFAFRFN